MDSFTRRRAIAMSSSRTPASRSAFGQVDRLDRSARNQRRIEHGRDRRSERASELPPTHVAECVQPGYGSPPPAARGCPDCKGTSPRSPPPESGAADQQPPVQVRLSRRGTAAAVESSDELDRSRASRLSPDRARRRHDQDHRQSCSCASPHPFAPDLPTRSRSPESATSLKCREPPSIAASVPQSSFSSQSGRFLCPPIDKILFTLHNPSCIKIL